MKHSKRNMGLMPYQELKKLAAELTNRKRELKQEELMKRQVEDLKTDKEIRKRVNDYILKSLLEKTQNNNDPEIRILHAKLKAHENYLI